MLSNELFEEYFLNSSFSLCTTNIGAFVLKYGGLDLESNCVYPLYEKNSSNYKSRIETIQNFLLDRDIQPIYRIVYQDNYENLDSNLFSMHYEKLDNSVVLKCNLEGKKEALFRYADFNESGIFIDENIVGGDEFLSDYVLLKKYNKSETALFNKTIDMIPYQKFGVALVEEDILIGQAILVKQEDVVIIKDIIIQEKYRQRGYSSKLLYSILTYCVKNSTSLVLAEVFLSNNPAVSLFESNPMFEKLYDVFYRHLPKRKGRFIFD